MFLNFQRSNIFLQCSVCSLSTCFHVHSRFKLCVKKRGFSKRIRKNSVLIRDFSVLYHFFLFTGLSSMMRASMKLRTKQNPSQLWTLVPKTVLMLWLIDFSPSVNTTMNLWSEISRKNWKTVVLIMLIWAIWDRMRFGWAMEIYLYSKVEELQIVKGLMHPGNL